jgi:hypothetical protein
MSTVKQTAKAFLYFGKDVLVFVSRTFPKMLEPKLTQETNWMRLSGWTSYRVLNTHATPTFTKCSSVLQTTYFLSQSQLYDPATSATTWCSLSAATTFLLVSTSILCLAYFPYTQIFRKKNIFKEFNNIHVGNTSLSFSPYLFILLPFTVSYFISSFSPGVLLFLYDIPSVLTPSLFLAFNFFILPSPSVLSSSFYRAFNNKQMLIPNQVHCGIQTYVLCNVTRSDPLHTCLQNLTDDTEVVAPHSKSDVLRFKWRYCCPPPSPPPAERDVRKNKRISVTTGYVQRFFTPPDIRTDCTRNFILSLFCLFVRHDATNG